MRRITPSLVEGEPPRVPGVLRRGRSRRRPCRSISPRSRRTPPASRSSTSPRRRASQFRHNNGAYGGKLLPETLGSGCAFLDYDADGWQDILLVNGMDWPGHKRQRSTLRLYRNNRNGTFTDVTRAAGLDVELYGMGVAVGDFNNDGFPDLFITCVGQNRLFRNTGKGTFVDVTRASGLGGREAFSTSAMWVDFDRDGLLDLFVCNYVKWSAEHDVFCSLDGKQKSYCTPEAYRGETCWLFRNRGNGTFEDVTATCGIFDSSSKSLGVALLDHDQDGWPDLFVANDTQPNKLYRNLRNGTFKDVALEAGVALSEDGKARAGMGVDAADFDNSGRPGLAITNFDNEMIGLYRAQEPGLYQDVAMPRRASVRLAQPARLRLRLRRPRSRRRARSRRRQRPHRRHRPQHPRQRRLRAAAAAVPQSGQRHVPRRGGRGGRRLRAAAGRPRPRVRRLRSRRRRRSADDDQQRTRRAVPQRSDRRRTAACGSGSSAPSRTATRSARPSASSTAARRRRGW